MGPKGRVGEFTFDFNRGVVSQYEEVFQLGVNRGIVSKPNQLMFEFGGEQWKGKEAFLEALRDNHELCEAIVAEVQRRDLAGEYSKDDEELAKTVEAE
jgi:hypothetical protein